MPLVIPAFYSNWTITVRNLDGGASGTSHISFGLGDAGALTQVIVDRVSNIFRDELKPLWDNRWEVGPIHVVEGEGSSPANVWDDTTAEAGTHAADVYAPPQVATVVTKRTGISGRAYRGRVYLPGVPQGYVGDDGGINPTYVSTVNTRMAALQTALEADAAIGFLALFHDSNGAAAGFPPAQITSLAARTIAGTMRPRLRR